MAFVFIIVFIIVIVYQWVRVFEVGKQMSENDRSIRDVVSTAEKHFQKAQNYLNNGFSDLAIEFFQKAQNLSPNNKKYIKGLEDCINVISRNLFIKAQENFNNRNIETAFKLLKRAHEINPDNIEYYNAYIKLRTVLNKN